MLKGRQHQKRHRACRRFQENMSKRLGWDNGTLCRSFLPSLGFICAKQAGCKESAALHSSCVLQWWLLPVRGQMCESENIYLLNVPRDRAPIVLPVTLEKWLQFNIHSPSVLTFILCIGELWSAFHLVTSTPFPGASPNLSLSHQILYLSGSWGIPIPLFSYHLSQTHLCMPHRPKPQVPRHYLSSFLCSVPFISISLKNKIANLHRKFEF